jgi:hypothetical protein
MPDDKPRESAVAKLLKAKAEEDKHYKCEHDVERVQRLILSAHYMRDYPATSALASSLTRELTAMSLEQAEVDAKDKEEFAKRLAEAQAADAKAYAEDSGEKKEEEGSQQASYPSVAPSAPRRT